SPLAPSSPLRGRPGDEPPTERPYAIPPRDGAPRRSTLPPAPRAPGSSAPRTLPPQPAARPGVPLPPGDVALPPLPVRAGPIPPLPGGEGRAEGSLESRLARSPDPNHRKQGEGMGPRPRRESAPERPPEQGAALPSPPDGLAARRTATSSTAPSPDVASTSRQTRRKPAAGRDGPVATTAPAGSGLATPSARLRAVGPSLDRRLEKLGLRSVRDLLYHFPSRHVDYSSLKKVRELRPGELTTVVVSVWDVGSYPTRRGLERIEAVTGDETGNLLAVWFRRRDYFGAKLRGRQVVLSGRVESRNGRLYLDGPEVAL